MVIQEMHYDFKVKLDKLDSLQKRNFSAAEIDWLLNEAQWVWIKHNYGLENPKKVGFETIESRVQDLRTLHIKSPEKQPALVPTRLQTDIYEVPLNVLDFEFLFTTRIRAEIEEKDCVKIVGVNTVETDDLNDTISDPFNRPNFKFGKVIGVYGSSSVPTNTLLNPYGIGSLFLYSRNFTIKKVFVDYIKYPQRLWVGTYDLTSDLLPKNQDNSYVYDRVNDAPVSSELPAHTHSEIVDLAVAFAAQLIEDPNLFQAKYTKYLTNK